MKTYFTLGAIGLTVLLVGAAFWQGYNYRGTVEELRNMKATQQQEEERRETNAAVNRLDNTGLRDAILRGNGKSK